ncbi:hypothetical protein BKD26_24205 [Streptomyces sp. CB03238]|nr:hypothetical protein BKD26_24205 [Streptomyces sp. CB03238]
MMLESARLLRARSYGEAAQLYEDSRPTYPEELIDRIARSVPDGRVVEIGAGTGKATRLLAARGLRITCVEPDPGMAEVLVRLCSQHPNIDVTVRSFEDWSPQRRMDGLVCAQAWHWLDPVRRWDKAAEVIAPGGLLALFWNVEQWDRVPGRESLEEVFSAYGQEAQDDGGLDLADWPGDAIERHPAFHGLEVLTYDWEQKWTAADFAAYRSTTSQVRILPADVREALTADVESTIERCFDGELTVPWRTYLFLARRAGR